MKTAFTVPACPRRSLTSPMPRRRQGVVVVQDRPRCPGRSAMVALVGPLRLTVNVSFGSSTMSPRIGTVDRLAGDARRERQRDRTDGRVVAAGRRRPVGCLRRRRSPSGRSLALSDTVNVALTIPLSPSRTVASPIPSVGRLVVVEDRPHALAVPDGGVGRVAQVDRERLVRLDGSVADDRYRHGLKDGPGREGQRDGRDRRVVAAGRCRPVRRLRLDRHGQAAGWQEGDRERLSDRSGISLPRRSRRRSREPAARRCPRSSPDPGFA